MCGFGGVILSDGVPNIDSWRKIAKQELAYRGPDQSAEILEDFSVQQRGVLRIAFFHYRLVTIGDATVGRQPMKLTNGYLLLNGAIYNYPELRDSVSVPLDQRERESDTCIVARLLEQGQLDFARMEGMFGLGHLDDREGVLTLARDRFGEKPLYYSYDRKKVVFGSSVHFVRRILNINSIPHDAITRHVALGPHLYGESTLFPKVVSVAPGSIVKIDVGTKSVSSISFVQSTPETAPPSRDDSRSELDRFTEILFDSVEKRTRGGFRFCVGLSGGVDSSLLTGVLRALYPERDVYSVSNIYPNTSPHNDESSLIKLTGKALRISQFFVEPAPEFVRNEYHRMIRVMDFPPQNTCMSGWATYSEMRRHGFRYSLEGQGADEVFAGYHTYLSNLVFETNPAEIPALLVRIVRHFDNPILGRIVLKGLAAKFFHRFPHILLGASDRVKWSVRNISKPIRDALRDDQRGNLRILLSYGDKSSLMFNIEQRLPYLAGPLVDFANSLPISHHIDGRSTKRILRAIASRLGVPRDIVYRRKKLGWPIPEIEWFQGPLRAWISQLETEVLDISREIGLVTPDTIARRLQLLNACQWLKAHGISLDRQA